MATSKKPSAPSKTTAAKGPQRFKLSANDASARKAIDSAVQRALEVQQLPSRIRYPIFVGFWLNPITKELEIINQVEDIQQG